MNIQPTTAPILAIQQLPEHYVLASGSYSCAPQVNRKDIPSVRLNAWMRDGWGYATADATEDADDMERTFLEDNCESCDYYFDVTEGNCDDMTDNNDNPMHSCRVSSCCPCYSHGVSSVSFPCKAGYDGPSNSRDGDDIFSLPGMVFSIHLDRDKLQPARLNTINIQIQVVKPDDLQVSTTWRASNVYEDTTVCWGNDNTAPRSLPEAVEAYADAPGNDDLLSVEQFINNANRSRVATDFRAISDPIIITPGYDAVLIASALATPAAFLLLAGSGFLQTDGLLMIGVNRHQHIDADGAVVNGYITDAIDGQTWLAIDHPDAIEGDGSDYDGKALLLGQIQLTPAPQITCLSNELSSSELAALAAG